MILINDAVWLFSKGLTELGIFEELTAPELECRRKKPWPFGKRIIEFMKAVSYFTSSINTSRNIGNGKDSMFLIRTIASQISFIRGEMFLKWRLKYS